MDIQVIGDWPQSGDEIKSWYIFLHPGFDTGIAVDAPVYFPTDPAHTGIADLDPVTGIGRSTWKIPDTSRIVEVVICEVGVITYGSIKIPGCIIK